MSIIGQFDSASTLARVLAAALRGERSVGMALPASSRLAARVSPLAPPGLRARLFSQGAAREAHRPGDLQGDLTDVAARTFTEAYEGAPAGKAPALFLGATNGALADLAAALGAPWLPQTFLVLMRQNTPDPDDAERVIAQAPALGERVLASFPTVTAHQMHDAGNDRLNVRRAAYFRLKWTRLPPAYAAMIEERLAPGGTLVVADCRFTWPRLRLGPRHGLQFGGYGGLGAQEQLARLTCGRGGLTVRPRRAA